MGQFNEWSFMRLLLEDKYGSKISFAIERDGTNSVTHASVAGNYTRKTPTYVMVVKNGDAIIAKSAQVEGYNKNYWRAEGFFELYKTLRDVVQ